jgi:hypothetical protein
MAWTRKKNTLIVLAAWLVGIAMVIGFGIFLVCDQPGGWHCLPTQVSSLAEVPDVGRSLSAWQTSGPVYYRHRPGFGGGCFVVVAGITSPEAIAAFRAGTSNVPDWREMNPKADC